MKRKAREFPATGSPTDGGTQLAALVAGLGLPGLEALCSRGLGTPVRTAASSWVRRVEIGSKSFFLKTYDYPTARARWRGLLRNTGPFRPSRAAREARALLWLRQQGLCAPAVVGAVEWRTWGLLARALLVTEAFDGEPLDRLLPRLPEDDRRRVAEALGRFVADLHRRGFRDGNLDLRNLLGRIDGGVVLAKIDSPRFVLVGPGRTSDRLARADWARLLSQLAPLGLGAAVSAAAQTRTGPAASQPG